jgi:hypothetical protein
MKKVLGMFLVLMAVMSIAVFAEPETYAPAPDGTYSVSYTGTSGNYYALLVVKGVYTAEQTPVISQDTVLYIDQSTATSSGVTFSNWIPKNDEPATVYLGGTGLDRPVLLGYLGENTFIVSGTVTTDSGTSYDAVVTLVSGEDTFTVNSVNGVYSIEVPEGTYTFTVNVKNHLSYTDNDFAVSADVSGKDVALKGGDIDASGTIEYLDLMELVNNYGDENADVDIDGNGIVEYFDLMFGVNNYNSTADMQ